MWDIMRMALSGALAGVRQARGGCRCTEVPLQCMQHCLRAARIRRLCGSQGATLVAVAVDGRIAAAVQVADALRPDAREAVQNLRAMGIRPILLSGLASANLISIHFQSYLHVFPKNEDASQASMHWHLLSVSYRR